MEMYVVSWTEAAAQGTRSRSWVILMTHKTCSSATPTGRARLPYSLVWASSGSLILKY